MGGLVAWEMAQQLMKEGETISLLALIDTAAYLSMNSNNESRAESLELRRSVLHYISCFIG